MIHTPASVPAPPLLLEQRSQKGCRSTTRRGLCAFSPRLLVEREAARLFKSPAADWLSLPSLLLGNAHPTLATPTYPHTPTSNPGTRTHWHPPHLSACRPLRSFKHASVALVAEPPPHPPPPCVASPVDLDLHQLAKQLAAALASAHRTGDLPCRPLHPQACVRAAPRDGAQPQDPIAAHGAGTTDRRQQDQHWCTV